MEIQGIEGLSPDEVRSRVSQGGRFVIFTWTVSFIVMTVRRPTSVTFINPGESALLKSLPYTFVSLFFGWWGIPWGFIYTPMSIIENLGGGRDVTNEIMQSFGGVPSPPPSTSFPPPQSAEPGSAFRGEPGTMRPAPPLSEQTSLDNDAKAALYLGLGSLFCFPAGLLAAFFGIRAISRARTLGVSTPGRAIAGLSLGVAFALCTGAGVVMGALVPKTPDGTDPPPSLTRKAPVTPVPARPDDGPVAEPGNAGARLALKVVKSYPKQKPSPKPPYHVAGGDWTYLDLEGPGGVEVTFGVQFKKSAESFSFGKAELFANRAFADAFDAKFGGAPGPVKAKKPGPLAMGVAVLGQDVVRHKGGGFGNAGEGSWVATKLFPEVGDRQGEVFFNWSVDEGHAEFSEKDVDYADDLSFVFHTAFAGK
ncbi:MAG: hypothetical protein JNK82_36880 [Myxococcaceae bacterium]|nr:hypothetical protein [Myxococcaceae bacterium]